MTGVCEVTPARELSLSFERSSAGRARAFLRSTICPVHLSHCVGDAELLVSELVANGVRHGAPPITLRAECLGPAGLHVSVHDGSSTRPRLRAVPAERLREGGRGLQIVDELSASWGVDDDAHGKTTWFRLGA